jgi:predicted unusual protein kinase regulating ubiquinone biosynthesis (AarF/ABC1/UbiB family)
MMGMITPRLRQGMLDCFAGITRGDPVQTVRGLDTLGFLGEEADREIIEQAVGLMVGHFRTLPFGHIRSVNQREVMGDIRSVLYDQPLRLPAQFAFFGRMVGMLSGLATTLDPNFNFLAVATPYAQQILGTSRGIDSILSLLGVGSLEELGRNALQDGIALARSLVDLPRRLDGVLARAERGDLHVVVEQPERTRQTRRGRRGTSVVASSSSPTQFLSRPAPLWLPLGVAAAFIALLTANMWRAASRER